MFREFKHVSFRIVTLLIAILLPVRMYATEFSFNFDSVNFDTFGCNTSCNSNSGCDDSTWDSCYFRVHGGGGETNIPGGIVNNEGINGTPAYKISYPSTPGAVGTPAGADMWFSKNFADSNYYMRTCYKMSSAWSITNDQKLIYWYYGAGIDALYLHIGGNPNNFQTLQLNAPVDNLGDGVYSDDSRNIVSHSNKFNLSQHYGEWWCLTTYRNTSTSPHIFKMWITTQNGSSMCAVGTACTYNGKLEYNEYLYFHFQGSGQVTNLQQIKYGAWPNLILPAGAAQWWDGFAISASHLPSNVFTGGTIPSGTPAYPPIRNITPSE